MASFSGTSGGSGGRGNQFPLKRIKIEVIKVEPDLAVTSESSQDSQLVRQDEQTRPMSSVTRCRTEHLKCPVCKEFPRKEVYQCSNGHIICHVCIANLILTHCPVCRDIYSQKKIRNRVAEFELGQMTYDCSYMNEGCLMTDIPLTWRNAHEIQCLYNPSPSGVRFCCLLDATNNCAFRIDAKFIMQDDQHRSSVIEHLKGPPLKLSFEKMRIGAAKSFQFLLPTSVHPLFTPLMLFEVCDGRTNKTLGYYVLIRRTVNPGRQNLSLIVVALSSAPQDLNGGNPSNGKIGVKFSIKAKTDPDKKAKDGNGCIPDQNWTTKPMELNKWRDFMMTQYEERPVTSFSLPLCFLHDYYAVEKSKFEMSISFGPLDG